jgi:hypothetical protein
MTGEAGLDLRLGIENPVTLCVHLVAGCAGNVFTLVCAAEPTQTPPGLMAAEAHLVLIRCRCLGLYAEGDRRISIPSPALGARMFFAGTMAGFALKIRKRRIRVSLRRVFAVEYCGGRLLRSLTVTQHAGVRAAAGVFLAPQNPWGKYGHEEKWRDAE